MENYATGIVQVGHAFVMDRGIPRNPEEVLELVRFMGDYSKAANSEMLEQQIYELDTESEEVQQKANRANRRFNWKIAVSATLMSIATLGAVNTCFNIFPEAKKYTRLTTPLILPMLHTFATYHGRKKKIEELRTEASGINRMSWRLQQQKDEYPQMAAMVQAFVLNDITPLVTDDFESRL